MSGASDAARGIKAMLDRYFGRPAVSSGRIFEQRENAEMAARIRSAPYGAAVPVTGKFLRVVLSEDFFETISYRQEDVTAMSEMPAPRHGSADARIYAFAKLMFDEVGPDEASRLADRYVAFTQQLIRPWPHETHTSNVQGERA